MKKGILLVVLCIGFIQIGYAQNNDNCSNATFLEIGTHCIPISFSNTNATAEEPDVAPDPSCGSYGGGDVWYKFLMPVTGAIRVEVDNLQGATPPSFTLYSGNCGNFNEIVCTRNDKDKTLYKPSLAGTTVYLRIYSFFNELHGNFSLCVFQPEIPQNDLCENARLLEVHDNCQLEIFSNQYATSESGTVSPDPSCQFYKGGDIWFKAIMPATGVLRVNKNRISGATHPSMVIYSGICGNFTEIFCSKNESTETLNDPTLIGQTLYFRLYSFNDEEGYSFSLCLYEEAAPINDDCEEAINLEVGADCTFNSFNNFQATAQPISTAPDPSCGAYQGGDVWFKLTMPESGALRVEVDNLQGATPPSFTIYTGNCGDFEEVVCVNNKKNKTLFDPQLAGKKLYIRAYTYNIDEGHAFSICVFEPSHPSNDNCEEATTLGVNKTCIMTAYSNAYATAQPSSSAPDPSCGQYSGGDVWFKVQLPANGIIGIEINDEEGPVINKYITVYTGACGDFTEVACGEVSPNLVIEQPSLAGEILYLRLYSYSTSEGETFDLCVYENVCVTDHVDAGEISICKGDHYIFGTQVLTEPGDYTELFQNKDNCDSLVTLSVLVNYVNTEVLQNGQILVAQAALASYQWINCINGRTPVTGATGQTFTTSSTGEYAVIVTENSCMDTSYCYSSNIVGYTKQNKGELTIFPNPVYNTLHIDQQFYYQNIFLELIDEKGSLIKAGYFKNNTFDMADLSRGEYILRIYTGNKIKIMKLIKE